MKKQIAFLIPAICMIATASCSDSSNELDYNEIPTTSKIELNNDETAGNKSLNSFAFDIFNSVAAGNDRNVSISPVSIEVAMGMLANSSSDKWAEDIISALGFADKEVMNSTMNKLMRFLPDKSNIAELRFANSIWLDNIYSPEAAYPKLMAETFYSDINRIDFTDPHAVRAIINSWVSAKTSGMISDFVPEDVIIRDFALVNALYFAGKWSGGFDKSKTRDMTFNGANTQSTISMMHKNECNTRYALTEKYEAATIPFADNRVRMTIVLPTDGVSVVDASQTFSRDDFEELTQSMTLARLTLDFPKFKVESEIVLNRALAASGIDLSKIKLDKLGIDHFTEMFVLHKTAGSFEEEGAVVAADTGNIGLGTNFSHDGDKVSLTVDRPFMYFITNTTTGSVLMAGRICDL